MILYIIFKHRNMTQYMRHWLFNIACFSSTLSQGHSQTEN